MTIHRLPIDAADPLFEFSVDLDGRPLAIRFQWNIREEAWFASVFADDADRTEIVTGKRVCAPGRLLWRARGSARPLGEIIFVDLGGTNTDPARDDLGSRVIALYYDEESWAELIAELTG